MLISQPIVSTVELRFGKSGLKWGSDQKIIVIMIIKQN